MQIWIGVKTISPLNPFFNVVIPWNSSLCHKLQKQIIRVDGAEKTTSAEKKKMCNELQTTLLAIPKTPFE